MNNLSEEKTKNSLVWKKTNNSKGLIAEKAMFPAKS